MIGQSILVNVAAKPLQRFWNSHELCRIHAMPERSYLPPSTVGIALESIVAVASDQIDRGDFRWRRCVHKHERVRGRPSALRLQQHGRRNDKHRCTAPCRNYGSRRHASRLPNVMTVADTSSAAGRPASNSQPHNVRADLDTAPNRATS